MSCLSRQAAIDKTLQKLLSGRRCPPGLVARVFAAGWVVTESVAGLGRRAPTLPSSHEALGTCVPRRSSVALGGLRVIRFTRVRNILM